MFHFKAFLVCLLALLGLIFGVALISLFVSLDQSNAGDFWHHIFGRKVPEKNFELPERERIETTAKTYDDVQGHEEWFTPTSRNLDFHAAILVAGSRGYQNYRHQADICHAFQVLKRGGLNKNKIITFLYDDIAYNERNPYPGKIYNKPGGEDVYDGCAKDYTGNDVKRDVLYAVLRGDHRAVYGVGSGRVLSSNPDQRVFFAYSDHGSAGSIGMPVGPPIFADELNSVFKSMSWNEAFKEMVVYIESCYAGSLFRGFHVEKSSNLLVVGSADSYESSYATYCPYQDTYQTTIPNATYIGSCLGDLFSVSWIEDTERADQGELLVREQVEKVKIRTSNYGSYRGGSHLVEFGDLFGSIGKQVIGNFLSYFTAPSGWTRSQVVAMFGAESENTKKMYLSQPLENNENHEVREIYTNYDQWAADLISLYKPQTENQEAMEDKSTIASFERELKARQKVDRAIRTSLELLMRLGELPKGASVHRYATELIPREGENLQVVNDWTCLKEMVRVWENHCGNLTDYSRQYTRTFANLCNVLVSPSSFGHSILNSLC